MSNRKEVVKRLRIIIGHLNKVREMVEEDEYCINILNQSLAVQNALKKVDELILDGHLNSCVAEAIKKNKSKKAFSELMEIFKRR